MAVLPDTFVLSVTYGFRLLVQAAPPLKLKGRGWEEDKKQTSGKDGGGGEMVFKLL